MNATYTQWFLIRTTNRFNRKDVRPNKNPSVGFLDHTGAGPDNAPPRIVAADRRVDHLVRVTGKWLIQLRDVSPKGIAALQSAKKGVWNSGAR